MAALAARGIRKSFGRRQVLTGADLDIAAGELVAVVGENGTGKTTLLRILAGDLRPDTGSVVIDGRPGYCPQTVVLDEAPAGPDLAIRSSAQPHLSSSRAITSCWIWLVPS